MMGLCGYRSLYLFLCPATKKVAAQGFLLYPLKVWVSVRQSFRPSAPPPFVCPQLLLQSFSNFTGAFRMVWRYAYCFFRILKLFFITFIFFIFNRLFSSPNTTEMYREYVPCMRNSSYIFRPSLLKLYTRFQDGLKICILFFFRILKLFLSLFIAFLT